MMNFDSGTAYLDHGAAESDADDEYDLDHHESSPIDATDVENSPIDSDPPSAEHTPTTYGYHTGGDRLPETIISEWTAEECADFIANIGVQQYADRFIGTQPFTIQTLAVWLTPAQKMTSLGRPWSPCNTMTSRRWASIASVTA